MTKEFENLKLLTSKDWEYAHLQLTNGRDIFCVVCYGSVGSDYKICFYPNSEEEILFENGGYLELVEKVRKTKEPYLERSLNTDIYALYLKQNNISYI
jgi:hypothetical protein